MTDQPPAQPPYQPSGRPTGGTTAAPPAPTTNVWHQATSTGGGRLAIAVAAAALAALMLVGVGVAGLLVLRNHDRFNLLGQQRGWVVPRGPGDGNQPMAPLQPGMPSAPGMPGGRVPGLGGMGRLLGGEALHGTVTATVDGSVQALVFQRGQVSAVTATSITMKSSDGFVGRYGRNATTTTMMAAPVAGGQALVIARASGKVAITILSMPTNLGVAPSN